MHRTLRLRAESLTELTSDELGGVAGAQMEDLSLISCPVLRCLVTYRLQDCIVVPTMPDNCHSVPWC